MRYTKMCIKIFPYKGKFTCFLFELLNLNAYILNLRFIQGQIHLNP
jgi:hypothetical protein